MICLRDYCAFSLLFQNYYYDTPSSVESLIAPGLLEQFETISEMELLSSALLSRPNSSIPERNVHRLIGTMMKTIVRLSCKWVSDQCTQVYSAESICV